jgi:hypothetical protein
VKNKNFRIITTSIAMIILFLVAITAFSASDTLKGVLFLVATLLMTWALWLTFKEK